MGNLTRVLLQISSRLRRWKNFENRPVFDEVMHKILLVSFFPDTVYIWVHCCRGSMSWWTFESVCKTGLQWRNRASSICTPSPPFCLWNSNGANAAKPKMGRSGPDSLLALPRVNYQLFVMLKFQTWWSQASELYGVVQYYEYTGCIQCESKKSPIKSSLIGTVAWKAKRNTVWLQR